LGSQSLRTAELDSRREVGLIIRHPEVVKRLVQTFELDWKMADKERAPRPKESKVDTEKIERVLIEELHPITATVKKAVNKVVQKAGEEALKEQMIKEMVKKVVKGAVKQAVETTSEIDGKT
jgi:hypothetical protein